MELKLHINGKTKMFQSPQPNFAVMLRTAELFKEMEQGTFLADNAKDEQNYNDLLKLRNYIVLVFNNQFTADEFDEGYVSEDMVDFFALGRGLMSEVMINPKKLANLEEQIKKTEKMQKRSTK